MLECRWRVEGPNFQRAEITGVEMVRRANEKLLVPVAPRRRPSIVVLADRYPSPALSHSAINLNTFTACPNSTTPLSLPTARFVFPPLAGPWLRQRRERRTLVETSGGEPFSRGTSLHRPGRRDHRNGHRQLVGGLAEHLLCGWEIRRATVPAPLFVLGLPRSGTTHLHNLLSRDSRFAFPSTFQTMNPRIFLLTENWLAA